MAEAMGLSRSFPPSLLIAGGGKRLQIDILLKAVVDELRRESADDRVRDIFALDLVKNKINLTVRVNAAQKIAVGLLAALFGVGRGRRQTVAHGACRSHDPSRQDAAVLAPIIIIEDTGHVEMGVAGEYVNI